MIGGAEDCHQLEDSKGGFQQLEGSINGGWRIQQQEDSTINWRLEETNDWRWPTTG